jgi:uncharacterized phage protein gp47/JayE
MTNEINTPNTVLAQVRENVANIVSSGVVVNVQKPTPVPVDLTMQIIYGSSVATIDIKNQVESYINNLDMGDIIDTRQIKRMIMNNSSILDTSVAKILINNINYNTQLVTYQAKWNEKFYVNTFNVIS